MIGGSFGGLANNTTPVPPSTTSTTATPDPCFQNFGILTSPTRSVNFNDGNSGEEICDDAGQGNVVSGNASFNDWLGNWECIASII